MKNIELYQKVIEIITDNIEDKTLNGEIIAKNLGVNRMYLHRKLKAYCNKNAGELIQDVRIKIAKNLLINDNQKINQIAQQLGFSDNSYFTKTFKKVTGQTPSVYKKSKV
jgi:AraC-like DNA-binding protein